MFIHATDLPPDLLEALKDCGRPGKADVPVDYVLTNYEVSGDEAECRAMLRGYGAWGDDELEDHESNLRRLVWLAGCQIMESGEAYFSTY